MPDKSPIDPEVATEVQHIQHLMAQLSRQYQRGALTPDSLTRAYERLDEARHHLAEILSTDPGHEAPPGPGDGSP